MSTLWMSSIYEKSRCDECGSDIYQDNRIVYDTVYKKVYCSDCGEEVAGEDPLNRDHGVKP